MLYKIPLIKFGKLIRKKCNKKMRDWQFVFIKIVIKRKITISFAILCQQQINNS